GVDRKAEPVITVVDGAVDVIIDPISIAANVKLKNFEGVAGGFCGFFQSGMGAGAEDHPVAEFACCLADRGAATWLEYLEPADGRAEHRDAQLLAEERATAVDL